MAKLLIVEDDLHLRKFYTREFSEDGYHVAEAADSQEALRVLADRPTGSCYARPCDARTGRYRTS